MERIEPSDGDLLAIEQMARDDRGPAAIEQLTPEQRDAIKGHILRGSQLRGIGALAADLGGRRAQAGQPRPGCGA